MKSIVAIVLILLVPAAAAASPTETFGFGPRFIATGNTATALATDYTAGFYNPAGAAFTTDVVFGVGYMHGFQRLNVNGVDNGLMDVGGTSFGLVVPTEIYPPFDLRLGFSMDLYLPDTDILRVRIVPATKPYFFMFDNRVNRVATDVAFSLGIPGLAIGGGVSILADTSGRGVSFEISTDLATNQNASARLGQSFPVRVAPIAGIMWSPWDWITLGLSYRAPIQAAVSVQTVSKIVAPYVDNGAAVIGVTNTNYYTPPKISMGVSLSLVRNLTVATDVSINLWSHQPDPVPDIQVMLDLQKLNPSLVPSSIHSAPFGDTVTNRVGAEYRIPLTQKLRLDVRAGYVFEPTPVPAQTGATNFMDSDRHVICAGAGLTIEGDGEVVKKPVSIDLFTQFHILERKLVTKNDLWNPVPPYYFDGAIYLLGLMGTLRF